MLRRFVLVALAVTACVRPTAPRVRTEWVVDYLSGHAGSVTAFDTAGTAKINYGCMPFSGGIYHAIVLTNSEGAADGVTDVTFPPDTTRIIVRFDTYSPGGRLVGDSALLIMQRTATAEALQITQADGSTHVWIAGAPAADALTRVWAACGVK